MGPGTDTATPLFRKPDLSDMGRDIAEPSSSGQARGSLFRKNDLDEMTVGRTEKPVMGKVPPKPVTSTPPASSSGPTRGSTDDPRPLVRGKVGAGSYEDGGEQKRKSRTKGKTGRPGR
jgi:excinuclease ABC subunit B